jgi:DmsE family decaheme c-type cytochrome
MLAITVAVRAKGYESQTVLVAQDVAQAATTQKPAPAPAPAQAKPAPIQPGYVGAAQCLTCHDYEEKLKGTPHWQASDPRSPIATHGCESCHGPGAKHAEDPTGVKLKNLRATGKAAGDAAVINATCTTCHSRQNHVLWAGSQHESRGLACSTCHSVHSFKSEDKQLKEVTQRELCATCHRDKISKLDRSGHMPVREQKMECSSCHNVHGSTNVRLLRKGDSIAELCTSCHAEKRGPYLWEHAPSRDGCVTCHDPHGSSNERMLVAKPPLLCQRCHVATRHPSTIYDQQAIGSASAPSVRIYARSCVTCHSAIHGSNHPSGQRFIR